jgi:HEAT repeat protein
VLAGGRCEDACDVLAAVAATDPIESVRVAASAALAVLGRHEGDPGLEAGLRSSDGEIRAQAAAGLAQLGQRGLAKILPLVDDPSAEVRRAAMQAFRSVTVDEIPLIVQFAQHADAEVRTVVALSMREAPRDPAALQVLLGLLRDDDQQVCDAAAESLVAFGDTALRALEAEIASDDSERQYTACWALGQLGGAAVDVLLGLSDRSDGRLLAEVIRALGRLGDLRGREVVAKSLRNEDTRVRVAAVRAMRRLAQPEDARAIAQCLADPDSNVRMVAVSVVGAVMTDELRRDVIELLGHDDPAVRGAAAQVLQQDANPASAKPLRAALAKETEAWVAELLETAIESGAH